MLADNFNCSTMGFNYSFTTSELLQIECPLQPTTSGSSSGCPQQSTRSGCPFGHRSAAVEAAISRRFLRPLPEHICIDHLLTEGRCSRSPQSFAGVADRQMQTFYWCPAGFHPQNLAALERIRRGQAQGLIHVNREVVCCPVIIDKLPLPPPPPPPALLASADRNMFRPSSQIATAAADDDDLVEDLNLMEQANSVIIIGGDDADNDSDDSSPIQQQQPAHRRSHFNLLDQCLFGVFCLLLLFELHILVMVKLFA